jgi:hypothetical protein
MDLTRRDAQAMVQVKPYQPSNLTVAIMCVFVVAFRKGRGEAVSSLGTKPPSFPRQTC